VDSDEELMDARKVTDRKPLARHLLHCPWRGGRQAMGGKVASAMVMQRNPHD
jgi:hypothetical protein